MASIDLDAIEEAQAAKRETEAETNPPTVTWRGDTWTLPPGPMSTNLVLAIGHMQRGDLGALEDALRLLLGDEPPTDDNGNVLTDDNGQPLPSGVQRFLAHNPSQLVTEAFIEAAVREYGDTAGNLQGPSTSPNGTGPTSKQTSKKRTVSTSQASGEDS